MDAKKILMAVASWFLPLIGIIYFFLTKDEDYHSAKTCLTISLISLGLTLLCMLAYIALMLFYFGAFKGVMASAPLIISLF